MTLTLTRTTSVPDPVLHPIVVLLTHWLNAVAILLMVTSGWRMFDASPFLPFPFPSRLTLGGWLGGALQWHFAAIWLLVVNGLVYVGYGYPMKLRVPTKLGFKNPKHIASLFVSHTYPGGYGEDQGYNWFGGS